MLQAPTEAEAQCAALAKDGAVHAAVSEDMDTLTFGAPVMLRNVFGASPISRYRAYRCSLSVSLSVPLSVSLSPPFFSFCLYVCVCVRVYVCVTYTRAHTRVCVISAHTHTTALTFQHSNICPPSRACEHSPVIHMHVYPYDYELEPESWKCTYTDIYIYIIYVYI
jgi:hypothetical protein